MHLFFLFFFNDTSTTEIYTLSLHDALPILKVEFANLISTFCALRNFERQWHSLRSEEHTSELQSLTNLVCRLLLEKKNKKKENAEHRTCSECRCMLLNYRCSAT